MNWMQSLFASHQEESGTAPRASATAIDPVGGETVAMSSALTSVYASNVYYFASRENRERFEAAPAQYVAKATGAPITAGNGHSAQRHRGCC